ncbi:MAG: hypothetical protein H0X73_11495 [Chthoniobacterales bacterium]|nr:hypothetical protein [Chthoniobacterales bacterium]
MTNTPQATCIRAFVRWADHRPLLLHQLDISRDETASDVELAVGYATVEL